MNKTIKIIDLLNKIANGEKVPEKIRYDDIIWTIDYAIGDYYRHINMTSEWLCEKYSVKRSIRGFINDTVEIIEDNNKLEKINNFTSNVGRIDDSNIEEYIHKLFEQQTTLYFKINKIIDYINKLEEEIRK